MNRKLKKSTLFEGCHSNFDEAEIVLIGAGYDGTSSYRTGSRLAPAAIRAETLYSQENFSPYFNKDITEKAIHDAGDINLPEHDKKTTLSLIQKSAVEIFKAQKKPCFIGGEHLISLPIITAALNFYPELYILHIDAHLDLMDELFGEKLSHGTVIRRVHDLVKSDGRIYQVGIRSGSKEEFQFAQRHTKLFPFNTRDFLKEIIFLKNKAVYLTLDLDVFDPSLLPGAGTPEAGGIFFPEYIELLRGLSELNIIGCDMVELSPKIDTSNTSTIVAAKTLRELLIIL